MTTPTSSLTPAQRREFFSGSIGLLIPPSRPSVLPVRHHRRPPHARMLSDPDFLTALLDESVLREILRFNTSALQLIGRKDVVVRLHALERDPEYVLVYLRDRAVIRVLHQFWECWREAGLRLVGPGEVAVEEVGSESTDEMGSLSTDTGHLLESGLDSEGEAAKSSFDEIDSLYLEKDVDAMSSRTVFPTGRFAGLMACLRCGI